LKEVIVVEEGVSTRAVGAVIRCDGPIAGAANEAREFVQPDTKLQSAVIVIIVRVPVASARVIISANVDTVQVCVGDRATGTRS